MPTTMKAAALMLPRRSEYVRGAVKPDNLVKLGTVLAAGRDWPFPPVKVRKLDKPVKRGGETYLYAIVDGVHRTIIALHSAGLSKHAALKGIAFPRKWDTIPVSVEKLSTVESEIEQLRSNLAHGLLVDRKHRDGWVRYLVKERKLKVPALAKMLHMTERSIFRMAAGTATISRPRRKGKRKKSERAVWNVESFLDTLKTLIDEGRRHKDAVTAYCNEHKDKMPGWLHAAATATANA